MAAISTFQLYSSTNLSISCRNLREKLRISPFSMTIVRLRKLIEIAINKLGRGWHVLVLFISEQLAV